MMLVLWKIMVMLLSVTAFNPMDLYVDEKEGFSLVFEHDGTKYQTYNVSAPVPVPAGFGSPYKQLDIEHYTRMMVGSPKEDNIYPITSFYNTFGTLYDIVEDVKVYDNSDGTVSLKCVGTHNNGLFARWYDDYEICDFCSTLPMCSESGICPKCRFTLTNGAITDIKIRLVGLTWGDPEEPIPSSPDQVDEDNMNNYSETTTTTTLSIKYEERTTDTTIWEHTWGFELSVSAKFDVGIPFVGGGSVTTTATASYNGKYGTETSESNTQTYQNSKTVECPPMTRCTLKVVASKLDNYDIPFTALVERTQDEGPPLQWEETGIWRGVQAFNFEAFYCTTSLETGDTNCPIFNWMI